MAGIWQIGGTGSYGSLDLALDSAINDDVLTTSSAWDAADTTPAVIANGGLTITASGSALHPGYVTNTNHYRLEVSTDHCVTVNSPDCTIDGIVVKLTSTTGSHEGFRITKNLTINNSIIYSLIGGTTTDQNGLYCAADTVVTNVNNCMIYGFSRSGICSQGGANIDTTWNINSCTVYDNGDDDNDTDNGGIAHKLSSATATVTTNVFNTISVGNNTASTNTGGTAAAADYNQRTDLGTYTWNIHNSIGSDLSLSARDTGDVGCLEQILPYDTDQGSGSFVIFEDSTTLATYDLRLQDLGNAKNNAQQAHTTASGAGLDFTGATANDIVGTSRPQDTSYDIGAFEIVAGGGGGLSIPIAYYHYNHNIG